MRERPANERAMAEGLVSGSDPDDIWRRRYTELQYPKYIEARIRRVLKVSKKSPRFR